METKNSLVLVPPGAAIKEKLVERKMSQKEFAARMDLSEKHVSHLMNGSVQLTPEVAYRLEMVLGVPASFWNQLEADYRESLVRLAHEQDIQEDIRLLKNVPLGELKKRNWVELSGEPEEQVVQLRQYFEVSKLTLLLKERFAEAGVPCSFEGKEFLAMAKAQYEKWESRERIESALDKADRQAKENPDRLSHEEVFSTIRENLKGKQNA